MAKPNEEKVYYFLPANADQNPMKDTPTIDGDVTDSQAKSMLLTGPQDPLPNLVVKRDVGDLFQDLSQPVNGETEEYTASQRSLLGAFEVSDLSNDAAIMLTESQFTRRTRSSTRLMNAAMKSEPLVTHQIEDATTYFTDELIIHEDPSEQLMGYQPDIDVYGTNGWPSPNGFYVTIPEQKKNSRNVDYLVSGSTLYTKTDVDVPFEFCLPAGYLGMPDTWLRVFVQYDLPTLKGQPVERCPNHVSDDHSDFRRKHFLQNDDRKDVEYGDATRMYDLTMPLTDSLNIKFKCFSSCSVIKRRPISLVFEVTSTNLPQLHFYLSVRACANPSRDAGKDNKEKAANEPQPGTSTIERKLSKVSDPLTPSPTATGGSKFRKRPLKVECPVNTKRSQSEDDVYNIQVYGRAKYLKVMQFIESLEKTERYTVNKEHAKIGLPSLFDNLTQVTFDTRVSSWLDEIAMGRYAQALRDRGITTMGDLDEHFTAELFESVGMTKDDAGYLNKAFLNWRNVYENSHQANE